MLSVPRFLARPFARYLGLLLALVLLLPSLALDYQVDDHIHRVMASGLVEPMQRHPAEMFALFPDSETFRAEATESGVLPWHAHPELRATFFRPLSSLELYVSHVLVNSAVVGHLMNLVWFSLMVLVTGALYRRLLPLPWVAALAVLLFALDDSHGLTAVWIAAGHGSMAMFFSTLAVLLHVQWREEQHGWAAVGAPIALLLGLLSAETALAMTAYLFAYAVWLDRGSLQQRLMSLLPCGIIASLWLITYRSLGYGFRNSWIYVDPGADPVGFLTALTHRLPILVSAQFTLITADATGAFLESGMASFVGVGLAVLVLTGILAWPALREHRALAGFFATGVVIAAIPMCSTIPQGRLLLPLGLGGFGLVALVLREAFWPGGERAGIGLRIVGWLLVITHLVLAPIGLVLPLFGITRIGDRYTDAAQSLDVAGPLDGKTVYFVRAGDMYVSAFSPMFRAGLGLGIPARTRTLGIGTKAMEVTRVSTESLLIRCEEGFGVQRLDRLVRDPAVPFEEGERFTFSDGALSLTEVRDGQAIELRLDADEGLEQADHAWVIWTREGYEAFALPDVGETVVIDALVTP